MIDLIFMLFAIATFISFNYWIYRAYSLYKYVQELEAENKKLRDAIKAHMKGCFDKEYVETLEVDKTLWSILEYENCN